MIFRNLPLGEWFRDEYMSEVAEQLYGQGNGFVHQIYKARGKDEFVVVFRVSCGGMRDQDLHIRVTAPYFDSVLIVDDLETYVGVEQADCVPNDDFALVYEHPSDEDD